MNDRFTMSHSFIIDEAEMDSLGNFRFNAKYWPVEDALYRIHIVKREDPVASLIIGGREENFYLFVANRQDSLFLDGSAGFARAVIKGSESNGLLLQMKGWVDFADSSTFAGTPIKRELIENAISEKLRQVAETIEYPLVALMALYYTDFKSNQKLNSQYYQDFLERWKDEDSAYFELFRTETQSKNKEDSFVWLYILALVLALFIGVQFGKYLKKDRTTLENLSLLSVQEIKIYRMLQEGKTNKEISEEHNIGVNTVKSHVSSILSKLKLKSRREVMKPDTSEAP